MSEDAYPSTSPLPGDYATTGNPHHALHDWRVDSDDALSVDIEIESDSIVVSEPDNSKRWGRKVWVELEDNVLRVHCYDGEHEEPLNVDIYEHKIRTWRDRDNE